MASNDKTTKISAKDLGALALPDFCERCFWIKRNAKNIPWQIFPGIFSSIDSYTKKVAHFHFDYYKKAPPWAAAFGDAKRYLKVPHWSRFFRVDEKTGITVSGMPDDILECENGSHIIPDYKTAKYTANADKLFPLYEAQLNAYAWIDEGYGFRVHATPLIYCEPVTDSPGVLNVEQGGFNMGFTVKSLPVENRRPDLIRELLDKAKAILDLAEPPKFLTDGCKDCRSLTDIFHSLDPWSPEVISEDSLGALT